MSLTLQHYAWIALGSALGGVLRYALGSYLTRYYGSVFPWGTFAVNVLGGALIGWASTHAESAWVRLFVMVGVCGGFTTFSSFSLETLHLLREGAVGRALLYTAASVLCCLGSVYAGWRFGKL